ncbi:MAG TPA: AAA family ATPase [Pseudomonadaceae bacterium]|nr:AAA family ATPase [Pseudomonadaceae bacterium]
MSIERIYITSGPYQDIISGIQMILSFSDGVVKLTGEEASGKTSLLHRLQTHMEKEGQQTLLFSPPPQSVLELHDKIVRKYGLGSDTSIQQSLSRYLNSQPREQQSLIMLFDDADHMDDDTLCDLLLFRDVKSGDQALVSIVLFGTAKLDQRLNTPQLAGLLRDIVLSYELNPLNATDLASFCKEAIPALGLRIALPGAQQLEKLLADTSGFPGAVLERLPALGEGQAAEEQAAEEQPELVTATPALTRLPQSGSAPAITSAIAAASSTPAASAPQPVGKPRAEAPLELVPLDDADTSGARPRKALVGGLALVASLAAAYFLYPVANDMLRPAPSPAVPPRTAATPTPAPVEEAPLATEAELVATTELSETPAPEAPTPETQAPEIPVPDIAGTEIQALEVAVPETAAPQAALQSTAAAEPQTSVAIAAPTDSAAASASTTSVVPTFPATELEELSEENLQSLVRTWLSAWQNQDLDGYFRAYHTDFAPLYQSTRRAWRDNRVRSIESPAFISIALEDFSVTGTTDVGVQVNFWMEYQSSSYADRTRKELVIGHDVDGSLRILQEINRQVVAVAPGASSRAIASTPAAPAQAIGSQVASQAAASASSVSTSPATQATATRVAATRTEIGAPVTMGSVYSQASQPVSSAGISDAMVEDLRSFLGSWLEAWQRQDLNAYFAHYHPAFNAAMHGSRAAWENDRSTKISRPLAIQIHLLDMDMKSASAEQSTVELRMEYHSSYYADVTLKDIALARQANGEWGIINEKNLQVTPLPISRLVPDRSITMRGGPDTVFELAL